MDSISDNRFNGRDMDDILNGGVARKKSATLCEKRWEEFMEFSKGKGPSEEIVIQFMDFLRQKKGNASVKKMRLQGLRWETILFDKTKIPNFFWRPWLTRISSAYKMESVCNRIPLSTDYTCWAVFSLLIDTLSGPLWVESLKTPLS